MDMVSSSSNVHHLPYITLGSREYPIDESSLKTVLDIPIINNKDMISELPNYILYHILSFLPTKDAVKTSILSTNWRYLWTFLSFFHFQMLSERETLQHRNNVGDFRSLTQLSLQLSKTTLCIPTGIQFPSLHTLILSYATFKTQNSLTQFLSRCPLLQNLTLNICYLFFYLEKITIASSTLRNLEIYIDSCCLNCHNYGYAVKIDAVNLLYLTFKSHPSINFRIVKPLTSLLAAYLAFSPPLPRQVFGLMLLRELASVKFLTLSNQTFMGALYESGSLHFLEIEFHNLTHLCVDLNAIAFSKKSLMKFLLSCPKLEVLVIPLACTNFFGANEALSTPVPPCFISSLKIIHFSNFDGFAIEFVKFLLQNAIFLEEIRITCSELIPPELNTLEKLKEQLEGFGRCAITYE